jgi:hypothetical protein
LNLDWLPPHYRLLGERQGSYGRAFELPTEAQVVRIFVRPRDQPGTVPLNVAIIEHNDGVRPTLAGLANRAPAQTFESASVVVDYHDGLWAAGPGLDARRTGPMVVHWATGFCHSLVRHSGLETVAVRGPLDLTVDDLFQVLTGVRA